MKRNFTAFFIFLLLPSLVIGQARMVFNNDGYVVIQNQGRLVIDNPNPNAITNPASGNIVTEDENNMVKWNIGNTTASTYSVPFTDNTGGNARVDLITSGSPAGGGSFFFSTYDDDASGAGWDNDLYRPSDVTHMSDYATGTVNNSDNAIDRFWIVDAQGYSKRPNAELTFNYIDNEHSAVGNSISESNLQAQRFNSSQNKWGDMLPVGSQAPNAVSGISVDSTDLFRSWTLVDNSDPLPVELVEFSGACEEGKVRLKWITESEVNNDFFTVEKSLDGQNFEALAAIEGAGNSNSQQTYTFIDDDPYSGGTFYRLKQTDHDGTVEVFNTISVEDCQKHKGALEMAVYNNGTGKVDIGFKNPGKGQQFDIILFDLSGRKVVKEQRFIPEGFDRFPLQSGDLPMGVYMLQVRNDQHHFSQKVLLN